MPPEVYVPPGDTPAACVITIVVADELTTVHGPPLNPFVVVEFIPDV